MRKGKTVIYIVLWIAVLAVLSLFMKPAKTTSCAAQQGNILVTGRSGYELPMGRGLGLAQSQILTHALLCRKSNKSA